MSVRKDSANRKFVPRSFRVRDKRCRNRKSVPRSLNRSLGRGEGASFPNPGFRGRFGWEKLRFSQPRLFVQGAGQNPALLCPFSYGSGCGPWAARERGTNLRLCVPSLTDAAAAPGPPESGTEPGAFAFLLSRTRRPGPPGRHRLQNGWIYDKVKNSNCAMNREKGSISPGREGAPRLKACLGREGAPCALPAGWGKSRPGPPPLPGV